MTPARPAPGVDEARGARGLSRRGALRAGACVLGGCLAACVGARIRWVNVHAPSPPEVVGHEMGEWVALDGAFLSYSDEGTRGYSIRVSGARICSYDEYTRWYADDGRAPDVQEGREGLEGEGLDTPSIVCLDLDLRNEESDGALLLALMYLVPERGNEFLVSDGQLLGMTEEALRGDEGNAFQALVIRHHTEYQVHPAFRHQGATMQLGEVTLNESLLTPVTDARFQLVVSNAPVRHVINVTV